MSNAAIAAGANLLDPIWAMGSLPYIKNTHCIGFCADVTSILSIKNKYRYNYIASMLIDT